MNEYWHAGNIDDPIFCHNLKVCSGRLIAVSFQRAQDPGLTGMVSPYEAFTREREKERVFEEIRAAEFGDQPSRLGAIFLFEDLSQAEHANTAWWGGRRALLSAEVVRAKRIGRFDPGHLNQPQDMWPHAARQYWRAILTPGCVIEVLVDGVVQLSGWEPYARPLTGDDWPA